MSSVITPAVFLQSLHILQAGLAAYGTFNSYRAITLLREYEAATKKAAKFSNEAQRQLDQTRSTQAAGAVAIVGSLVAALTLAFGYRHLGTYARFGLSPAFLIGTVFARKHISSFWGPQGGTRVPLPKMGDFNQAQRHNHAILQSLQLLEYSWVITSFGWGMIGK